MDFGCKDCVPPKRHVGCHSTCETYIQAQKERERIKAVEEEYKLIREDFIYRRTKIKKSYG